MKELWNEVLVSARNLVVTLAPGEEFMITSSISSPLETVVDLNGLRFLSFFVEGATLRAAYEHFHEELHLEEEDVLESARELIRNNLLLRQGEEKVCADALVLNGGMGSLRSHHKMLADHGRVMAYRAAIFANARDKVVLDLGCGTGLLSIFAAQAGAKKVYAIDETAIIDVAKKMALRNGAEVTFLGGNSLDVKLPERVDLILHELIGIDPLAEDMLRYLDDAQRRFIKPGGTFLPHRLTLYCALAQLADYTPHSAMVRSAQDFSRYGLDVTPFVEALSAEDLPRQQHLDRTRGCTLLSEPVATALYEWRGAEARRELDSVHTLTANRSGQANALLSWFVAELDSSLHLSNAPWAPETHWGTAQYCLPDAIGVEPGTKLRLHSQTLTLSGHEQTSYRVSTWT